VLLIYCSDITPRHAYIIPFILEDICGFETRLTSNHEEYRSYNGYTLNYNYRQHRENDLQVIPNGFLDLLTLQECSAWIDKEQTDLPLFIEGTGIDAKVFDPFAAAFYMLSRYEEYFNFKPDKYGRFEASASMLYHHDLLETPVVNKWSTSLKENILLKYPGIKQINKKAKELVSIDVDQAYAFRHRGFKRNILSLAKNLIFFKPNYLASQLNTIILRKKDPFDTYDYLESLKEKQNLEMIFFVNLGAYSKFDKNLDIKNESFRKLLLRLKNFASIGIHPSYYAIADPDKLHKEKKALEEALNEDVIKSRQHFFRLLFPHTYRELIHAGIREDYTMGFASHPGFRAGCCTPFFWFDLQKNTVTELKVFPVTYMDGALAEDLGLSKEEALEKINNLAKTVIQYDGLFLSIWHNHSINDRFFWKGWRTVFEKAINQVKQKN
jgi:hypothetical protein